MALDKTGLGSINPSTGLDPLKRGSENPKDVQKSGEDFRKALDQAGGVGSPTNPKLDAKLGQLAGLMNPNGVKAPEVGTSSLKFSNHAVERMRSRGIHFGAEEMRDIEGAIQKAAAKGSKDTLVLSGENALVVSVKNNTVVTVMDRATMKNNVFTNIDSTVVI